MFQGSLPALVTPLREDGEIDWPALERLVDWHIDQGSNGLVPVGTTGESPTLSHDEHKKVVEWCIHEAKGRVPVIAGAGSNSTKEAVELAQHAEKAGADAVLVVTPQPGMDFAAVRAHAALVVDTRGVCARLGLAGPARVVTA